MGWPFLLIVAFGLGACSPKLDTISVQEQGALTYHPIVTTWTASRDGRLEVVEESAASPSSTEQKQTERVNVTITDQQFDELKAALAPVRQAIGRPTNWPCTLPDGSPIRVQYSGSDGSWRWTSADGCEQTRAREIFGAAQNATAMLRRWSSNPSRGSGAAPTDVPLANIYTNPEAFEGKAVTTCGWAPIDGPTVIVKGLNFGRSPAAIWLDRPVQSASGCLEANVVRSMTPTDDPNLMDGPVTLKGWRLKVRRALPSN